MKANERPTAEREYYTRLEVAALLSIHPNTLDNLRKRQDGPPYIKLSPRILRYPKAAYRAWEAQQSPSQ